MTNKAVCVLQGDGPVPGVVHFEQKENGQVMVLGSIIGLTEGWAKGSRERHVEDLGNVTASKDGVAHVFIEGSVTAPSGDHFIVGCTMVGHEKSDDLGKGGSDENKKTGNAGSHLACSVRPWDRPVNIPQHEV